LGGQVISVSEAPGQEEDETGRPYMGKAGKFWESMLATSNIRRESLYVCNALKCRPPKNEIPDDYHNVHACNVHLLTQISIIQPNLIIVFGKVAAYSLGLLKKSASLSSIVGNYQKRVGKKFEYVDFKGQQRTSDLIVTYHPSYLMRRGAKQQIASWESYNHLMEARSILDGLVIPKNTK
jgi:DNA polymerase